MNYAEYRSRCWLAVMMSVSLIVLVFVVLTHTSALKMGVMSNLMILVVAFLSAVTIAGSIILGILAIATNVVLRKLVDHPKQYPLTRLLGIAIELDPSSQKQSVSETFMRTSTYATFNYTMRQMISMLMVDELRIRLRAYGITLKRKTTRMSDIIDECHAVRHKLRELEQLHDLPEVS